MLRAPCGSPPRVVEFARLSAFPGADDDTKYVRSESGWAWRWRPSWHGASCRARRINSHSGRRRRRRTASGWTASISPGVPLRAARGRGGRAGAARHPAAGSDLRARRRHLPARRAAAVRPRLHDRPQRPGGQVPVDGRHRRSVPAGRGSVIFGVWVDGKKVADSGLMRGGDAPKLLDRRSRRARARLVLAVIDGNDGTGSDNADWAGALITMAPGFRERPVVLARGRSNRRRRSPPAARPCRS